MARVSEIRSLSLKRVVRLLEFRLRRRRMLHRAQVIERAFGLDKLAHPEPIRGRAILESLSDRQFPGFLESFSAGRPSRSGLALPWLTFPAIAFLDQLPLAGKRFLEVGAGSSTVYWAQRGMAGTAVEVDEEWASRVREELSVADPSGSVEVVSLGGHRVGELATTQLGCGDSEISSLLKDDPDHQLESHWISPLTDLIHQHLQGADLVVIDGVLRNLTASLIAARPDTCAKWVVFDNTDRYNYASGRGALSNAGWIEIPFVGLVPGNSAVATTSVFLRPTGFEEGRTPKGSE